MIWISASDALNSRRLTISACLLLSHAHAVADTLRNQPWSTELQPRTSVETRLHIGIEHPLTNIAQQRTKPQKEIGVLSRQKTSKAEPLTTVADEGGVTSTCVEVDRSGWCRVQSLEQWVRP
jgi:hypothetical protein